MLGGVALGVLTLTVGATAQDNTPGREATLLQQIVVGSGVDKVAIDTPQAVTVLDQEAIDDDQAMTIGDVFRDVPGVTVIGSHQLAGQSFNIRASGKPAAGAYETKI